MDISKETAQSVNKHWDMLASKAAELPSLASVSITRTGLGLNLVFALGSLGR